MQTQGVERVFTEEFRPRVHFTPPQNWMNDPNGLLYYKGKYHLFYQHNPEGILWGNMSWGHATSTDLLHWEHLPLAIPYTDEIGIFSGSAVVDHHNTTGFGTLEKPAIVAIFTAHLHSGTHQSQHLAFSLDEGITWRTYKGNPVLDEGMKDFRDPKVTWEEATHSWLMTIAKPEEHKIAFYRSKDLKSWSHLSDFGPLGAKGGCWECPDLFTLTTQTGEVKWVLLVSLNPGGVAGGSGTQYFIGDWDGEVFSTTQTTAKWLDYGRDNYAGVTFNDAPDGKRVFIGWMSNWLYANKIPTQIWRSSMTLPRTLSLITVNGEELLQSTPVALTEGTYKVIFDTSRDGKVSLTSPQGTMEVRFNSATAEIEIDRSSSWLNEMDEEPQRSPKILLPASGQQLELTLIIDNGSLELFAPTIGLAMTSLHLLQASELKLSASGGATLLA